ncbi:uncharacterized protein LOC111007894 [Momordica charantia]|uniref:Uncharacterized protein LOC111007894 n=1 Tax=Momordica charantia TaxID=3673 RepID=A0A6J1C3E5_MOMCH|nr:uncharacterized protein LOC111007894 [Momordica charantia]
MKLAVENLTGSLFHIQVKDDATVSDLKAEISAHHNNDLPSDRLIFIADDNPGRPISKDDDGFSLVDCGVKDGSHIYIFFHPLDHEDDRDHGGDDPDQDHHSRLFFFTCHNILLFDWNHR